VVLGAIACVAAAAYLSLAYPATGEFRSGLFIGVLVVFLVAACLLALVAPPALTSNILASRTCLYLGIGAGSGCCCSHAPTPRRQVQ